ncbi:polysaccharide lyase family 7 protein [Aquimarina pacifica]|uniref:polysaccharide lyase family 7 protein n=1 Tax=Aquimarina pacifica TaxID=1296415 RepID=UPI00046EE056|nr:polysaccharide lyase family 7 protein [Aquimarina pacifica]
MKIKNYSKFISVFITISLLLVSSCSQDGDLDEYNDESKGISLNSKASSIALDISSVSASAQQSENPAENAIDSDSKSRWSGQGYGVNYIMDLGEAKTIDYINIAWYKGDERVQKFEIWVRESSSTSWSQILKTYSTGTSASLEKYDLSNMNVQFVRIKCFENSVNDWNSITDIELFGLSEDINTGDCQADIPSGKSVNSITKTSATFSWNAVSNIDHYNVRYRASGSSTWTLIKSIKTTSATASDLQSDTTYEWQIRAKCADNTGSSYSAGQGSDFTTEKGEVIIIQPGNLDPNAAPSENFDLTQWYLSIPLNNGSGVAQSIYEVELNNGFEKSPYFYTDKSDGGMIFKNYVDGYKTSTGTTYTRSELREMLRGDDYKMSTKDYGNNWVFSNSSDEVKEDAAAVGGILEATLKINHVTTSGNDEEEGRVVIGQIHASKDEPCRLYYHKPSKNSKGAIYFAHEPSSGSEKWYNIIGNLIENKDGDYDDDMPNPSNGIGLDEQFSYKIEVSGTMLYITITKEDNSTYTGEYNMSSSGFEDDWMYFKAGVYSQNKTGNDDDYDEATFYNLSITH